MSICVSPDSLDWSKVHHMRNVAASNALLGRLREHHSDNDPVISAPIQLVAPKPTAALIPIVVVKPKTVPRSAITYGPGHYIHLQCVVAKYFGITRAELVGQSRRQKYAVPRQVAMFLAHDGKRTLPEIGRRFGRDHSTVNHAIRKIERYVEQGLFDMPATVAKLREALAQ